MVIPLKSFGDSCYLLIKVPPQATPTSPARSRMREMSGNLKLSLSDAKQLIIINITSTVNARTYKKQCMYPYNHIFWPF